MPPCNDEQRSQRALQACNRVRSALAKVVNLKKERKPLETKAWHQRQAVNRRF
jgi:hypothetical protein